MTVTASVTGQEQDLAALYRRYNAVCNDHRFDLLAEFVREDVVVNGGTRGLRSYVHGLQAVVQSFPDHRWDLRHLVVQGDWVAAHFADSGTHRGTFLGVAPTGRAVSTQEFAFYRFAAGRIAEVWVTADDLRTLDQLR